MNFQELSALRLGPERELGERGGQGLHGLSVVLRPLGFSGHGQSFQARLKLPDLLLHGLGLSGHILQREHPIHHQGGQLRLLLLERDKTPVEIGALVFDMTSVARLKQGNQPGKYEVGVREVLGNEAGEHFFDGFTAEVGGWARRCAFLPPVMGLVPAVVIVLVGASLPAWHRVHGTAAYPAAQQARIEKEVLARAFSVCEVVPPVVDDVLDFPKHLFGHQRVIDHLHADDLSRRAGHLPFVLLSPVFPHFPFGGALLLVVAVSDVDFVREQVPHGDVRGEPKPPGQLGIVVHPVVVELIEQLPDLLRVVGVEIPFGLPVVAHAEGEGEVVAGVFALTPFFLLGPVHALLDLGELVPGDDRVDAGNEVAALGVQVDDLVGQVDERPCLPDVLQNGEGAEVVRSQQSVKVGAHDALRPASTEQGEHLADLRGVHDGCPGHVDETNRAEDVQAAAFDRPAVSLDLAGNPRAVLAPLLKGRDAQEFNDGDHCSVTSFSSMPQSSRAMDNARMVSPVLNAARRALSFRWRSCPTRRARAATLVMSWCWAVGFMSCISLLRAIGKLLGWPGPRPTTPERCGRSARSDGGGRFCRCGCWGGGNYFLRWQNGHVLSLELVPQWGHALGLLPSVSRAILQAPLMAAKFLVGRGFLAGAASLPSCIQVTSFAGGLAPPGGLLKPGQRDRPC
ncbi:hypothetical protein DA2_3171 [Desulfovibrio sp. A2]|nr:hypothetical protein DA2_3171 [Desulfovibrio sp. A2]